MYISKLTHSHSEDVTQPITSILFQVVMILRVLISIHFASASISGGLEVCKREK
ncbi:hypothetical protein ACE6H2_000102 [Prunus campanulata]